MLFPVRFEVLSDRPCETSIAREDWLMVSESCAKSVVVCESDSLAPEMLFDVLVTVVVVVEDPALFVTWLPIVTTDFDDA